MRQLNIEGAYGKMVLLISLVIGVIIGYKNIVRERFRPIISKLFNSIFILMLATLGFKIFASNEVANNIGNIGILAVFFTVCTCIGSVLITLFLINWIYPDNKQREQENDVHVNYSFDLKEAIKPILAIVIGAVFGLLKPNLAIKHDQLIYWLMLCLILGIGIDIGQSREELSLVKTVGWLGLIVPLGALTGSLIGSFMFGLITGMSPIVSMAIGAGSGFYSVTAPLVAQVAGNQYGALALITNFLRETLTIIFLPIIALRFRHPALVTLGGATTMDTTLPVIMRSLGSKAAMIGLVQGILLSLFVPIILPIILNM
jgi:uncharacterized membrane protein YbjE (DUF340 family)